MSPCPNCNRPVPAGAAQCPHCFIQLPPPPPPPPELPSGTRLQNGRYEIRATLGQGGFGITYHAYDHLLQRPVALKEFFPFGSTRHHHAVHPGGPDAALFPTLRQKTLGEAQRLAQLNHSGVVRLHRVFEENNTVYLDMEFLEGETLEAYRQRRQGRRLPEAEAVALMLQACEAVAAVHQAGLLHRDIKPDNIMRCRDGRVVLIDFGAAREATGPPTQTVIVSDGYSPLEQYSPSGVLGAYSDVYALGATLYCLLVGVRPPPAPDRQSGASLVSLAGYGVSARVARAVAWALELEASRRPQTVEAWMQALQPSVAPLPLPLSPKRKPSWATFVLGLLSAVTLVVSVMLLISREGSKSVEHSTNPSSVSQSEIITNAPPSVPDRRAAGAPPSMPDRQAADAPPSVPDRQPANTAPTLPSPSTLSEQELLARATQASRNRDYAKVIELYDQLIREFGEKPLYLNNKAWYLALLGRHSEALPLALQAVERENNVHYWHTLGFVYAGLGRWRDALQAYERALRLDATMLSWYPDMHYDLAVVYEQLGNRAKAREHYEQFLRAERAKVGFPENLPKAQNALRRL